MNKDKFLWHLPISRYKLQVIRTGDDVMQDCEIHEVKNWDNTLGLTYEYGSRPRNHYSFDKNKGIYKGNTFASYDTYNTYYVILTCLDMPETQQTEVLEELQKINAKLDKIIEGRGYG